MYAKDIMTTNPITVSPDSYLNEAGKLISEKRISGLPVTDEKGGVVGIITLTDLLKILNILNVKMEIGSDVSRLRLKKLLEEKRVDEFMQKNVITLDENSDIVDICRLMFENNIHTIPIVKNKKLVGVVGKRDLQELYFQ